MVTLYTRTILEIIREGIAPDEIAAGISDILFNGVKP